MNFSFGLSNHLDTSFLFIFLLNLFENFKKKKNNLFFPSQQGYYKHPQSVRNDLQVFPNNC